MSYFNRLACCGISELVGADYERPIDFLHAVFRPTTRGHRNQAYIIFSSTTPNGDRIAEYIVKHKLGELVGLKPKRNPNSGNKLKAWLWSPNRAAKTKGLKGRRSR